MYGTRVRTAAATQAASSLCPRVATTRYESALYGNAAMFGIRSPPRTAAPSKRSGSANAGRSSMTATSKSRSRAWRAMARETWPPPAMTSCGRLVTGSTSSSCPSSSGTSRAVPWRICSMAASRARSSRPAEPSVPSSRPPARTSTRASSRSVRPARWKADTNATGGPPRAASPAAAIASMPSTAAGHAGPLPASARIHMVPPHTSPVSQASSSVSWCSRTEPGSPARTLRAASNRVRLHASAAEGAEGPLRLVAGQDQLGADDLRGAPLGPDHRRHGERDARRGELLHAFERRSLFVGGRAQRGLRAARIYSNT